MKGIIITVVCEIKKTERLNCLNVFKNSKGRMLLLEIKLLSIEITSFNNQMRTPMGRVAATIMKIISIVLINMSRITRMIRSCFRRANNRCMNQATKIFRKSTQRAICLRINRKSIVR